MADRGKEKRHNQKNDHQITEKKKYEGPFVHIHSLKFVSKPGMFGNHLVRMQNQF